MRDTDVTANATPDTENENSLGVRQTYLVDGPDALFSIRMSDRVISLWPSVSTPQPSKPGSRGPSQALDRAWTAYVSPFVATPVESHDSPLDEESPDDALLRVAQFVLASALAAFSNSSQKPHPEDAPWIGLLVSVTGGKHLCPQRMHNKTCEPVCTGGVWSALIEI